MYCYEMTICDTSDDSITFDLFLEDPFNLLSLYHSYNYFNIGDQLRWFQKKAMFEINYDTDIEVLYLFIY